MSFHFNFCISFLFVLETSHDKHFTFFYHAIYHNVCFLLQVDDGCIEHLLPSLYKDDWDVLIAHFLGVVSYNFFGVQIFRNHLKDHQTMYASFLKKTHFEIWICKTIDFEENFCLHFYHMKIPIQLIKHHFFCVFLFFYCFNNLNSQLGSCRTHIWG